MKKASLEKIAPGFGSSFTAKRIHRKPGGRTSHWHFHPEYEIVYISHGKGRRHIGHTVSHFQEGDLIFLGPNIPHYGFDHGIDQPHMEIVIQMKPEFLEGSFFAAPEFEGIRDLFDRSRGGIIFSGETKWEVSSRMESLPDLEPLDRLLTLLKVLQILSNAENSEPINANGITVEVRPQDHQRMDRIYQFVKEHFKRPISLEEIAEHSHMTVPSFCRYFKKITRMTFTRFVNEFRVEYACKLLREEEQTVFEVSLNSGFNNLSHFNKQFREITGTSPTLYRKNQVWVVKEG